MAGQLTTHALDTALGVGAAGLMVQVRRVEPSSAALGEIVLDERGRGVLLDGGLVRGVYEVVFDAAAYHRALGVALSDPPFLDKIAIRFGVSDPDAHYHVPLLLTPYGYSTYRGG